MSINIPSCHPKRVNELKAEAEKGIGFYLAANRTRETIEKALKAMQDFQSGLTAGKDDE